MIRPAENAGASFGSSRGCFGSRVQRRARLQCRWSATLVEFHLMVKPDTAAG